MSTEQTRDTGMDIKTLELTEAEMGIVGRQTIPVLSSSQWPSIMARVAADAATAKALWGIVDWLESLPIRTNSGDLDYSTVRDVQLQAASMMGGYLTEAGIQRPEGGA